MNRNKYLQELVPKDVKTILDIGSDGNIYEKFKTKTLDLKDGNFVQDLDLNPILPFKDNSFDLVVANQILEHLNYHEEIIQEIERVSKKYIFIGLPNELTWYYRLRLLFETPSHDGYARHTHKHFFTIRSIKRYFNQFFPFNKKTFFYGSFFRGSRVLPDEMSQSLTNLFPTLFCKELYCLIEKKKVGTRRWKW